MPANKPWILVANTSSHPCLESLSFSGPKWNDLHSEGMEFESQEEAEKYSQALKTLFDIHTTPTKLT